MLWLDADFVVGAFTSSDELRPSTATCDCGGLSCRKLTERWAGRRRGFEVLAEDLCVVVGFIIYVYPAQRISGCPTTIIPSTDFANCSPQPRLPKTTNMGYLDRD